jgi:hypothetical protein
VWVSRRPWRRTNKDETFAKLQDTLIYAARKACKQIEEGKSEPMDFDKLWNPSLYRHSGSQKKFGWDGKSESQKSLWALERGFYLVQVYGNAIQIINNRLKYSYLYWYSRSERWNEKHKRVI